MRRWYGALLLCPGLALAAELPDSRMLVAKMVGGLALVLLLVLALVWLLKRLPGLPRTQGMMRLRGSLMLGPRERLVWVQVGQEQLLLGVAPGRVELLRTLDAERMDDAITSASPEDASSFAARLQGLMKADRS